MPESIGLNSLASWESAAVIAALALLVRAAGHAVSQVILARKGIIMMRGIAPVAQPAPPLRESEDAAASGQARQDRPPPEQPDMHDHQEFLPLETRRAA